MVFIVKVVLHRSKRIDYIVGTKKNKVFLCSCFALNPFGRLKEVLESIALAVRPVYLVFKSFFKHLHIPTQHNSEFHKMVRPMIDMFHQHKRSGTPKIIPYLCILTMYH